MANTEPIIKPSKKFCRDRFFLRYEDRSLSVAEQKLLDFLLWCSLKYQSNIISFSPNEYFVFHGFYNPSGKQYIKFYEMLRVLFKTCLFWDLDNYGGVSHILDDLIFNIDECERKRNTLIQVELHQSLLQVLTWQRSNVILNLNMTKDLKCEYSYHFFVFLLVDYIGDGAEHIYKKVQLRNYLNVAEEQSDVTFKALLRRAIKEISKKTFLNLSFRIRGNTFIVWNNEKIQNSTVRAIRQYKDEFDDRLKRLEIMVNELRNNPFLGR